MLCENTKEARLLPCGCMENAHILVMVEFRVPQVSVRISKGDRREAEYCPKWEMFVLKGFNWRVSKYTVNPVCPDCDEAQPDERILAGMKCGRCAY